MSKLIVTVVQYKEFMNATGRDAGASCWCDNNEEDRGNLRVAKRGSMSEEVRSVTNSIRLVREF
jgi:formylglycine-generating enzyme required for sulfatase activity